MPAALGPQDRLVLDANKELLAHAYERGMAYTNLILGAGYAGFFATWTFTRDRLTDSQTLWSALFVIASLISFVLFEVYKTFYISRTLLGLSNALGDIGQIQKGLAEWSEANEDSTLRFGRIWSYTFPFTLLTGLAGAAILVYAFVYALIRTYS